MVKNCLDTYQKIYNLYKIFNCHEYVDKDKDKDFYGLCYEAKEIHDAVNET
ncbi:MAG: hypothetical protein SPI53_05010 [Erysipelotrichaceae bacterium]|nr:hypothetical protein [Erysipelotrichaceae bacterium]